MSTCSQFFLPGRNFFKKDKKAFKKRQNLKGFFFSCFKNPVFCCKLLFSILFLLIVIGSGLLLRYYPVLTSLGQGQEKIDNLFLGQALVSTFPVLSLSFVEQNSVKAMNIPQIHSIQVLTTLNTLLPDSSEPKDRILEYIVEPDDTLSAIAEKFGISLNTIIWANDLLNSSNIKPGQKLIILPVSGILHYVKNGETLSGIAKLYEADIEEINSFNELSNEEKIFVGDLLIIPGGKMPKKSSFVSKPALLPLPDTLFIYPVSSPYRISQGLHWYNAIDFSNGKCGASVFAVAGGKIQRTGYHRIAGNYIRILHPSGIVTFYGHLSKVLVSPDQDVSQGQIIAYTGYSGYTIPAGPAGCHLHFEVRGARNPFAK